METPKSQILTAKLECETKIIDAIVEFEKRTGFDVKDVEYNIKDVRDQFGVVCSRHYVTIVISL